MKEDVQIATEQIKIEVSKIDKRFKSVQEEYGDLLEYHKSQVMSAKGIQMGEDVD
jgi:hypothetical protein